MLIHKVFFQLSDLKVCLKDRIASLPFFCDMYM